MKGHFLKAEEFSIIEYARHIKMNESLKNFGEEYSHTFLDLKDHHIDIRNFTIYERKFIKFIPMETGKNYLQIFKSKNHYDQKLWQLKQNIISIQLLLLLLFAYISYLLAKNALEPLQESINRLDKFAKDLIHDLNTPVTSIKLNIKLLEKKTHSNNDNVLKRLKKSVHTIAELHDNLTILLEEETFQMKHSCVFEIIDDVVQIEKQIYPDINFVVTPSSLKAKLNSNAFKQIVQNIISNACKYNSKNGFIKIYEKNNSLYIQDTGKGIDNPSKIFDRSYSGENGSGIGLDIVKRLATSMSIDIEVISDKDGSIFILKLLEPTF